MATDDVKFDANEIAKIIANETNSGGGGNKFSAQVGIKDINSFEKFLQNSKSILESKLNDNTLFRYWRCKNRCSNIKRGFIYL